MVPDDDEDKTISFTLPGEPVVIFLMIAEQLNMHHGRNRLTLSIV